MLKTGDIEVEHKCSILINEVRFPDRSYFTKKENSVSPSAIVASSPDIFPCTRPRK